MNRPIELYSIIDIIIMISDYDNDNNNKRKYL